MLLVEAGGAEEGAAAERSAEGIENDGGVYRERGIASAGVLGGSIKADRECHEEPACKNKKQTRHKSNTHQRISRAFPCA